MKNIFKKTIAFFMAFIITFNLILFNYQRSHETYAFVDGGVAASVAGSVVFSLISGYLQENIEGALTYATQNDFNQIVKDYIEYDLENFPEEYDEIYNLPEVEQSYRLVGASDWDDYVLQRKALEQGDETGTYWSSIPIGAVWSRKMIKRFKDWLADHGLYDSSTGTYNYELPSSGSSSGDIYGTASDFDTVRSLLVDYTHTNPNFHNTFTAPYFDSYFNSSLLDGNLYYYCGLFDFNNNFVFGLLNADKSAVLTSTYVNDYGAYGYSYPLDVFTGQSTVVIAFSSDSSALSAFDGDNPVYGPDINFRSDVWQDIEKTIEEHNSKYAEDVTVHNADGTTNVYNDVTNVYYPVRAEEVIDEETGETAIVVTPLSAQEIVDLGLDFNPDKVFEKPAETVITNPYVDTSTGDVVQAGAITGAVSITNSQAIADAIAGDFVTGKEGLNDFEIKRDLTTVFPFCLPFDIMRILDTFRADPVCPVITFDFSQIYPFSLCPASYHDNLVFTLDFADYDIFIQVEKYFVIINYVMFLITKTRSALIRG